MSEIIYKREDVLNLICSASWGNNLAFSLDLYFLSRQTNTFLIGKSCLKELLSIIILKKSFSNGDPYPIIATKIINIVFDDFYSGKNLVIGDEIKTCYPSKNDIILAIKKYISKIVDLEPDIIIKNKYFHFFNEINPNWIITTNYGNIIEKVVGDRAFTILPERPYFKNKYILPVYHIHGSIIDSKSIIISNEDYAETLRPYDYRHIRLPIFMKESTVVMLGVCIK